MEEVDKLLNRKNVFTDLLEKIENTIRIPRRIQILSIVLFVLLYLAEGYAAALLCNVLSLLLPMCASINAIENPDFESDTKWLMYWVIFSCMNFLEMFISWIPSYSLLKFLFLVWCMAPGRLNGSEVMYFRVIRPFFMKHRACVNDVISDAAKRVRQVAEKTVDDFMIARANRMVKGTDSSFSLIEDKTDSSKKVE
jgi:receptor expression-enhancing protein 5/6